MYYNYNAGIGPVLPSASFSSRPDHAFASSGNPSYASFPTPYARGGGVRKKGGLSLAHMSKRELDVLDHLQGGTERHNKSGVRSYRHLEELLSNPHLRHLIHSCTAKHHAYGGSTYPNGENVGPGQAQELAQHGRYGDREMALIGPNTHALFRAFGGPTMNPQDGHPEYFSLGGIFSGIGDAIKGGLGKLPGIVSSIPKHLPGIVSSIPKYLPKVIDSVGNAFPKIMGGANSGGGWSQIASNLLPMVLGGGANQPPAGQYGEEDPYGQQGTGGPYDQGSADPYGQQGAGDPYGQQGGYPETANSYGGNGGGFNIRDFLNSQLSSILSGLGSGQSMGNVFGNAARSAGNQLLPYAQQYASQGLSSLTNRLPSSLQGLAQSAGNSLINRGRNAANRFLGYDQNLPVT